MTLLDGSEMHIYSHNSTEYKVLSQPATLIPIRKLEGTAVPLKPLDLLPRADFSQLHTAPRLQPKVTLRTKAALHSKNTTSKASLRLFRLWSFEIFFKLLRGITQI